MSEIIHFIHMPKCGGQSLKKGLEQAYGDDVYFFYLIPMPIFFYPKVHLLLWRIRNQIFPHQVPVGKKIVFGHFCFNDLKAGVNTDIKRAAFFRDPVEWVGSYYFYVKNKYPDRVPDDIFRLIRMGGLSNGFRKYLGKVQVKDLEFVGLQEEYKTSLQLLKRVLDIDIPHIIKNKTMNKPEIGALSSYREYFASKGILDRIEYAMAKNTAIYNEAVDRYYVLLSQNNIISDKA